MLMRDRKFKGFAMLNKPDGSLIWDTFRPNEADAKAAYLKHNPQVQGFESAAIAVPCEIFIRERL